MPAAEGGDQPASAVVVSSPPHVIGDTEFFVHIGGRSEVGRRALKPGEHIDPAHPLVKEFPGHFRDSNEPPDTWVEHVLSAEALQRQRVEQQRLASRPARMIQPICTRCGEAAEAIVVDDQPSVLAKVNALAIIEDHDWAERWRIETTFDNAVRTWQQQQAELARVEGEFRATHLTCPPDTPPLDDEPVPVETRAMHWRLPAIRSAG